MIFSIIDKEYSSIFNKILSLYWYRKFSNSKYFYKLRPASKIFSIKIKKYTESEGISIKDKQGTIKKDICILV